MKSLLAWVKSFNRNDPAIEFYPGALEVLESPPSPAGRAIGGMIILFCVLALIWSVVGKVDIIATAQGKIVPTGRIKVIQPLEAGVVRSILVQDGQTVKEGDVLIEIDSTINESERNRLQTEYVTSSLEVARLRALLAPEGSHVGFHPPEGATPTQIETQKSLLINQSNEIHAKLSGLDNQIAQNEGNRAAVASTVDKLKQSIPLLAKRTRIRENLSSKGYSSKLETLTAEQDLVEHQQELNVQEGRLIEATAGVASLKEQRKQAEAEFHHTNLDKLAEEEQHATSLKEQLAQASQKFRLQTLRAPVDGTVQQLEVHTEGGVVTPAEQLLVIVPTDSHIEIEAMISNRDIGFVHVGQPVQVKVDTFNFTRYGLLRGKVTSVSHDSILRQKPQANGDKNQVGNEGESSELAGQELVYNARISLDKTSMDIEGTQVSLTPGMAVTAEIRTGSRRIISYLLSPIQRHRHQAWREQ